MNKEKAIMILEHTLNYWKHISNQESFPIDDDIESLQMAIKALSEPERKPGKWIDITKAIGGGGFLWKCSECGDDYLEATDYCPSCGAKMTEEQ